ncbi:histidine kinase [Paenibacillus sp. BR2-3]|uniref:sensor histidine kinase n=1 Tax=Paenibacillus sp. BR2-3 TaxID=3048494 RepID=UPI0039772A88
MRTNQSNWAMRFRSISDWGWVDTFAVTLRLIWFVTLLVSILVNDFPGVSWWVITWFSIAYVIPQLYYLPGRVKTKLFIFGEVVLSGSFNIYIVIHFQEAINNFVIPLFIIGLLSSATSLKWVLPICFIVFPASMSMWGDFTYDFILSLWFNYAIFFAFGFCFQVILEQKLDLTKKNQQLEHYNRQIERMTILEERNRIARELHDTVGHSLIATIVAMEAVESLIERDPSQAKQRLNELITYGRNHLTDFRQTVHDFSMTELKHSLPEIVAQLTSDFAGSDGHSNFDQGSEPRRCNWRFCKACSHSLLTRSTYKCEETWECKTD